MLLITDHAACVIVEANTISGGSCVDACAVMRKSRTAAFVMLDHRGQESLQFAVRVAAKVSICQSDLGCDIALRRKRSSL